MLDTIVFVCLFVPKIRATNVCEDIESTLEWALAHDREAQMMGLRARRFSQTILGPHMLSAYVMHLLQEISALQRAAGGVNGYPYEAATKRKGMEAFTIQNIAERYERTGKGGVAHAAISYLHGLQCPTDKCMQCCFHSPGTVRHGGNDTVYKEFTWWTRLKNAPWNPAKTIWKEDGVLKPRTGVHFSVDTCLLACVVGSCGGSCPTQ